jgi:hypothetical protein
MTLATAVYATAAIDGRMRLSSWQLSVAQPLLAVHAYPRYSDVYWTISHLLASNEGVMASTIVPSGQQLVASLLPCTSVGYIYV